MIEQMRLMEYRFQSEPIESKTAENDSVPAVEPATAPDAQESKPDGIERTVAGAPPEDAEIELLTSESGQLTLF